MAMTSTNKVIRYTSPKGTAKYPWLTEADTQFVKEGQFHVQLEVSQDKAVGIIEKLTAVLDDAYTNLCREKGKKLNKVPFFEETDEGNVIFKFKQNRIIKRKDGTTVEVKIPLFDSKGKPIMDKPKVGNGSVIKTSFTAMPYFNQINKGVGLSLRLVAVQIIDLVEFNSGNAESYGFDAEEEGYEATSSKNADDDDPPFETVTSEESGDY